ncbi:MAG: cob(I)yrinic acid a,c-diamide adenosyltransferase [Chloroflexota bacterium]|nr:cob(I)yrinic acid a,c-diamide adenosyltransferase [Chloroflexota bacterium]
MKQGSRGLIQVYTGDGKGKTTAALGLAIRAAGRDLLVIMIQFLKGEESGEHLFLSRQKQIEILQLNTDNCFQQSTAELQQIVEKTWSCSREKVMGGEYDVVILDEVFVAISREMLLIADVLDLMRQKPDHVELVLTGRNASPEIVREADLVTEMLMIKHPHTEGIGQRIGIEL